MLSYYSQVITTTRNPGRKVKLDISRFSTDYDSYIVGPHRNALLPNEGSNEISKPDIYTASKPDLFIPQCAKYLFNYPLDLNINTPSSNLSWKGYGTLTTLPKDTLKKYKKESQPGGISRKEGNRPEDTHITSFQNEHYSKKYQGQLCNIITLNRGTIIYIELSTYKQAPSSYVIIPTHKGYILPAN